MNVVQIFNHLDDRSLAKCKQVSKSFYNFIDNEKFFWLHYGGIKGICIAYTWNYQYCNYQKFEIANTIPTYFLCPL